MSRRRVLQAILLAAVIVAGADLLAQRMARNSVPRQLMRTIANAPATIDVIGIGNSLMAAGFDSDAIEQTFQNESRRSVAVNGGLGATGVIEHLLLTRLALRHHAVKTVIYGFFDQQLSTDVVERNSAIIGNRNLLYYQEPEVALQYARFDTLERLSFDVYRSCALLRERGAIWAKVEKLRRTMGSLGMPPEETNQFGRANDFALLAAKNSRSFILACQRVLQSGEFISAPVQALLRQSKSHGAKAVVVEMPMHPLHLRTFYEEPIWEKYRLMTRVAVESEGAAYVDASEWIPDRARFADHLHLSKAGAKQFSQLLAKYLIRQSK